MAAFFTAASSQYLINTATPVTAAPFSVGFWFKMPTGGSTQYLWSLADNAGNTNFWNIYLNASNQIENECATSAGVVLATAATAITTNAWSYVLYRAISATNRRLTVLHATGTIDNAQSTTSRAPAGVDRVGLGAYLGLTVGSYLDGSIAEYWMANVDVQPGGAAMQDALLRQIARNGPFSVPHIRRNLVDYRSLRESLTSDSDHAPDYHIGGTRPVRQVWTNTNGVTLGPHVPLPGYYEYPKRVRSTLMV